MWEKMTQLQGRIAGRMRNIFGDIQPELREGYRKCPRKGGIGFMVSLER